MKQGRFSEEQMVGMLREADRSSVAEVASKYGVSEQTLCHRRGVLAACLDTLPRDEHARQRAALVVECIDPCVGYAIEVDGHA